MENKSIIDKLVLAWWDHFHNQRVTVRDIISLAVNGGPGTADLRMVLEEIAPSQFTGGYSSHKLGHWLTKTSNHQNMTLPFKLLDLGVRTTATGRYWQLLPQQDKVPTEEFLPLETFGVTL